jgi:hypothetical protein
MIAASLVHSTHLERAAVTGRGNEGAAPFA